MGCHMGVAMGSHGKGTCAHGGRTASGVPTSHAAPEGRAAGGFSLVELSLVMGVLLFTLLVLSSSLGESIKLGESNEETALAIDGARQIVEVLDGVEEFGDVFALYNADPGDDPDGPGTAPGAGFAVEGLQPAEDDPDQLVGEIVFPAAPDGSGGLVLDELLDDPDLGMPRDLDGNGLVDSSAVTDYRLLPVLVRMRWVGTQGERTLTIRTLLADR